MNSVRDQNYSDIQYIIVDGKSTDNTPSIIENGRRDSDIFVSEKDNGIYDAMNKGLALAGGDVVGFLNSDDFYADAGVIDKVMETFFQTGADAVYGNLHYVDQKNPSKVIRKWRSGNYQRRRFLFGWMPPHPAFFCKRSVFEQYGGFNLMFRQAADYELMLRFLYKHEITCAYVDKTLVKMRIGGKSNASLKNRLTANREDALAWKINNLKSLPFTRYMKPLRKVFQYV